MGMHLWQVVGRHVPTERNPKPKIFRMKVFAEDEVRAPFSGHTFSAERSGEAWRRCRPGLWPGRGCTGMPGLRKASPLFGTPRSGG